VCIDPKAAVYALVTLGYLAAAVGALELARMSRVLSSILNALARLMIQVTPAYHTRVASHWGDKELDTLMGSMIAGGSVRPFIPGHPTSVKAKNLELLLTYCAYR
jgi:hypothetical protein